MTFHIDHLKLEKGIYPVTENGITTYDIRVCRPYRDSLMSISAIHSVEHILAVGLSSRINKIYFGPMGCLTGFYLLSDSPVEQVYQALIDACDEAIINKSVPFNKRIECGNADNLCYTVEVQNILETIKSLSIIALRDPSNFQYPLIEN